MMVAKLILAVAILNLVLLISELSLNVLGIMF